MLVNKNGKRKSMPDAKGVLFKSVYVHVYAYNCWFPLFLFSLLAKCSMERKAKGKKLIRISIRQLNGIFYLLCHLLIFIWKFKSEIVLISKPIQMCIYLSYSQFRGFTCNCNKRAPLAGAPHSKTN